MNHYPPPSDPAAQPLSPTPEQVALVAAYPDAPPFVMVNLLKFKGRVGADRYWGEYSPSDQMRRQR